MAYHTKATRKGLEVNPAFIGKLALCSRNCASVKQPTHTWAYNVDAIAQAFYNGEWASDMTPDYGDDYEPYEDD